MFYDWCWLWFPDDYVDITLRPLLEPGRLFLKFVLCKTFLAAYDYI